VSFLVVRTNHRTPFLSSRTSPTASKLASRVRPLFCSFGGSDSRIVPHDAARPFNDFPARCALFGD
jgi:hypothetical protein